jgi:putative ABC transport system ATP-binding protein
MSTLLKLKKINLKYQTNKETIKVLNNIDLTTKKKDTISIVGESGSGKTSLIMLIGGLEKATSGKIYFQDQDLTTLSEDEISNISRKNIGIVLQDVFLFSDTILNNITLKNDDITIDQIGRAHV